MARRLFVGQGGQQRVGGNRVKMRSTKNSGGK